MSNAHILQYVDNIQWQTASTINLWKV